MGYSNVGSNFSSGNLSNRPVTGAGGKLPPSGDRTLIWVDVKSSVKPGKDGNVELPDDDIERAVFAKFGLSVKDETDLEKLKSILKTTENPFQYVKTSAGERRDYRADHTYHIPLSIQNSLLAKLSRTAVEVNRQIKQEKLQQNQNSNPNEIVKN